MFDEGDQIQNVPPWLNLCARIWVKQWRGIGFGDQRHRGVCLCENELIDGRIAGQFNQQTLIWVPLILFGSRFGSKAFQPHPFWRLRTQSLTVYSQRLKRVRLKGFVFPNLLYGFKV